MNKLAERLMQLRALKKEISLEQSRLRELRESAAFGRRQPGQTPVQGGQVADRTGSYAVEIAFLEQLIEQNMQRALCELLRMQQFMDAVPDADMRCILKLRYVKGMSWRRISFEMGGYLDEDAIRKRHDRFLARAAEGELGEKLRSLDGMTLKMLVRDKAQDGTSALAHQLLGRQAAREQARGA